MAADAGRRVGIDTRHQCSAGLVDGRQIAKPGRPKKPHGATEQHVYKRLAKVSVQSLIAAIVRLWTFFQGPKLGQLDMSSVALLMQSWSPGLRAPRCAPRGRDRL
jgi:hypothetical protein